MVLLLGSSGIGLQLLLQLLLHILQHNIPGLLQQRHWL
jgi:energy-coupling factor transporter ATP-binding protein EcfA2